MILRAALLGCGWMGSEFEPDASLGIATHAAAYTACADTQLVAVCDADPAQAERAGERWQVSARYTEAARLLAEAQPEIVSICTPDDTHHTLIRAALETPSVRGIFAEKPLALQSAQARELAELARARGVVLAVNYTRRYATAHAEVRRRIEGGEFGRIVTVGGFYTKGTLHNGTHWFDLARLLIGEVSRVTGFDLRGEFGSDPSLDAVLQFANGASGHLQAYEAAAGALFEMDILGTLGRVRVAEPTGEFATWRIAESRTYPGYRVFESSPPIPAQSRDTLLHAVEDVVRCVIDGSTPRSSAADGCAAVRIAEAVRESARSGQPISLAPDA